MYYYENFVTVFDLEQTQEVDFYAAAAGVFLIQLHFICHFVFNISPRN